MKTGNTLCGFECVFSKKVDAWKYLKTLNFLPKNYCFSVVEASVFLDRRRVEIAENFAPNYFQEINESGFVGEGLVLHLYPDKVSCSEIENYNEYIKSPCEMIILLYDFYYLEIYCKNADWLKHLINVANSMPNAIIEEKYEETDTRTTMYV